MNKKIICIGEVLWDCLPLGLFPGGAPFNVACHLHMLKQNVKMFSRVGDDILGHEVIRRMQQRGMSTQFIQTDKKKSTGLVYVDVKDKGLVDYEIVQPSAWDYLEENEQLIELTKNSDAVIFGTLAQRNEISARTIQNLLQYCPLKICDINLRPPFDNREIVERSLELADFIKLNDQELLQISQWFNFPVSMKESTIAFAEKFDCQIVCVTRGENGAALLYKGDWFEHSGFKVIVKDTVGSGDSFLAGLLTKLMADEDPKQALTFANAIGAYVASCDGATPELDFNKINNLISNNR